MLIDGDFIGQRFDASSAPISTRPIRAGRCFPPTRRTAPAPAGSRNLPTPAWATSSSGACSTRRSSTRWCGASRATRRGSTRRSTRTFPRRSIISRASFRRRLSVRRDRRSPTSPIASFFRNGAYAGFEDRRRSLAAHRRLRRAHARPIPAIAALLPFEDVQRSAEIKGRRQALLDAGAPLTDETLGVREPRKGLMRL